MDWFYNYGRSTLTFTDHAGSGNGRDDVGRFIVIGRSTARTMSAVGPSRTSADTIIAGFRKRKGIWGLWELPSESGGFHIWLLPEEEGEQEQESREEPVPVETVATES